MGSRRRRPEPRSRLLEVPPWSRAVARRCQAPKPASDNPILAPLIFAEYGKMSLGGLSGGLQEPDEFLHPSMHNPGIRFEEPPRGTFREQPLPGRPVFR